MLGRPCLAEQLHILEVYGCQVPPSLLEESRGEAQLVHQACICYIKPAAAQQCQVIPKGLGLPVPGSQLGAHMYSEQCPLGRRALLRHTHECSLTAGFAALLHAQWCAWTAFRFLGGASAYLTATLFTKQLSAI